MTVRVSQPEKSTASKALPEKISFITGKDLRIMRLHAEITALEMAQKIGVKSRKTIENWELQTSEPKISTFIRYCVFSGFNPSWVITEVLKRNKQDPTQKQYYNLDACIDHDAACQYKLKKQTGG